MTMDPRYLNDPEVVDFMNDTADEWAEYVVSLLEQLGPDEAVRVLDMCEKAAEMVCDAHQEDPTPVSTKAAILSAARYVGILKCLVGLYDVQED